MIDSAQTIDKILSWITNYTKLHNKKSIVYGVSGGVASTLLHSIVPNITSVNKFAYHFNGTSFNDESIIELAFSDKLVLKDEARASYEAASRMSVLNAIAHHTDGIVIGTACRSRISLVRHYHKRGDGAADIFPFADLFYSDLIQLLLHCKREPDYARLEAHEKAIGVKWADIEWADKENRKTGIIHDDNIIHHHEWFKYTSRQKEILARINFLEKHTRHKTIHKPFLQL